VGTPLALSSGNISPSKMPIIYALVARGTNVLAEHTTTSGNFTTITRKLLEKIPSDAQKMSPATRAA
jgi:hypothetical protein